MNPKRNNTSAMRAMGTLGLGALIGAAVVYLGTKIVEILSADGSTEKVEVPIQVPIQPQNRPVRQSEGVFTAIDAFHCPISLQLMTDPAIIIKCSHTFERTNIVDWLRVHGRCPVCNCPATLSDVKPNYNLKNAIVEIRKNQHNKKEQERLKKEDELQKKQSDLAAQETVISVKDQQNEKEEYYSTKR